MADAHLELMGLGVRGGGGGYFACPVGFSSFSDFFYTEHNGEVGVLGPFPTSTTDLMIHSINDMYHNEKKFPEHIDVDIEKK